MDEPDVEKTPSIGISYQIQTRQSRQLVLQSFVGRDCMAEELDALLDKMRNAGERQMAWEKIDDLTLQLKQEYINAADQQVRIDVEDVRLKQEWSGGQRRGDLKLTQHQLQKQREALETAEGIKTRIANIKEALALFKSKVGMTDASL
jgi:hypothetical protein